MPQEKLHQLGAEIKDDGDTYPFLSIFAYVPWKHHVLIVSKCKSIEEAAFYIKLTIQEALSKSALLNCIKAKLYGTQGNAVSNSLPELDTLANANVVVVANGQVFELALSADDLANMAKQKQTIVVDGIEYPKAESIEEVINMDNVESITVTLDNRILVSSKK